MIDFLKPSFVIAFLMLLGAAVLSGCASGHNYSGALLLGIFLPDPNRLTAEDREIMAREQAEADAAERRAKGVGQ